MHKYELEGLLDRTEAIQRDVLRHLDEEPQMVQIQGMTEVLLELRRSLTVVRGKLRRMDELTAATRAEVPRAAQKRH